MKNFPLLLLAFSLIYIVGNKINNFVASVDLNFFTILYLLFNFIILCFIVRILRNVYLWFAKRKNKPYEEEIAKENKAIIPDDIYNPYKILGVDETASNDEIKEQWKKLVKQNHPDNLASKGLSTAYIELGNKLMSDINSAYDIIAKERKLK